MSSGVMEARPVVQVGVVCRDIEETSKRYAEFFGVPAPEWHLTEGIEKTRMKHRGVDSSARAKLAFLDFGQVQLELIEPDEHPSTWREFLDEKGEGIHHIAFVVDGMKRVASDMEDHGYTILQKGEYSGGRYAYVDTSKSLKLIIELLENDRR
jgi:catechol 2,3-dioxygenase-like lactoylglutathione lyase family enzyme